MQKLSTLLYTYKVPIIYTKLSSSYKTAHTYRITEAEQQYLLHCSSNLYISLLLPLELICDLNVVTIAKS